MSDRATRPLEGRDQATAIASMGQAVGYQKPDERLSLVTAAKQPSRERL